MHAQGTATTKKSWKFRKIKVKSGLDILVSPPRGSIRGQRSRFPCPGGATRRLKWPRADEGRYRAAAPSRECFPASESTRRRTRGPGPARCYHRHASGTTWDSRSTGITSPAARRSLITRCAAGAARIAREGIKAVTLQRVIAEARRRRYGGIFRTGDDRWRRGSPGHLTRSEGRGRDSLHALKAVTLRRRTRHARGGLGVRVVLEALEQRPRQIAKRIRGLRPNQTRAPCSTRPIAP